MEFGDRHTPQIGQHKYDYWNTRALLFKDTANPRSLVYRISGYAVIIPEKHSQTLDEVMGIEKHCFQNKVRPGRLPWKVPRVSFMSTNLNDYLIEFKFCLPGPPVP